MAELTAIHVGGKSEQARALASAMNRRFAVRSLKDKQVKVYDREMTLTRNLLDAAITCAWAMGAQRATLDKMDETRTIPPAVARMIRNPGRRNDKQKALGKKRIAAMRKARKKRAAATKTSSNRDKAVNAFLAKVGTRESPPGSNGGGIITIMEAYWGFGRVPWCGCSFGYHAERYGGVDLKSDVASVQAIVNHAKARDGNYGKFQSSVNGALPGSAVIIGGPGVHVGMLVKALADGSALTVEGNTSFGPGGSQANGGCIAKRHRSDAEIYGIATMDYPK